MIRAYVQLIGSEFHTRNARSRQLQEQRSVIKGTSMILCFYCKKRDV